MSEVQPPSEDAARGTSLQELISESARQASPRVSDLARLATAVQAQRFQSGVSDTSRITRTAALWAAMEMDEPTRTALEDSGIRQAALGKLISVPAAPPAASKEADLNEYFARALRGYLSQYPQRQLIDLPDITAAILLAARDDRDGLLPDRLSRLKGDLDSAVLRIEDLISGTPPAQFSAEDYSRSVQAVRQRLGPTAEVAAARIAEAIQKDHGKYGDGRFAKITLRPEVGRKVAVDEWLRQVRSLYDMGQVSQTRHQAIDGQLTLLGLAELDDSLAEDLRAEGFLDKLAEDAELIPQHRRPDRTEWSSDAPATTDRLGRQSLAETLVKRLERLMGDRTLAGQSFLIHVDGPWGAGKSSLFQLLREKLQPAFLVVEVNAWREQQVGLPWWTLLTSLRRGVTSSRSPWLRPAIWLAGFADRIRANWMPFVAAVLVVCAAVIWFIVMQGHDLGNSSKIADSALKIISLASVSAAGLVAAARYLLLGSRRSAQGFVDTNDNPMQEVRRLFARTLKRARKPVVYLIDDLDRCDDAYVVEFLEVMQTLVRDAPEFEPATGRRSQRGAQRGAGTPGTRSGLYRHKRAPAGPYAFIAADGRWIRSSYERHYCSFMSTSAPGRPLGYLFLEKIFQLHIRLPSITPSTRDAFFASLLNCNQAQAADGTGAGANHSTPSDSDASQQSYKAAQAATERATGEAELVRAARLATAITDPQKRMEILGNVVVRLSDSSVTAQYEHELTRFRAFLEPNPRTMRLFVNTYGIERCLRTLEEVLVPTGPLALWTVIEIRWPLLADYLRNCPSAFESPHDGHPEEIRPLLTDPEVMRVVHDRSSGPLTPDLIRQCSGAAGEDGPQRGSQEPAPHQSRSDALGA